MSKTMEEKLDKIAIDVAETRGMLKEAIPNLKTLGREHDIRISKLERDGDVIKTKVATAGAAAGVLSAGFFEFIARHFHF